MHIASASQFLLALSSILLPVALTAQTPPGHSVHGEAFDEGPRDQAWKMTGMGNVHFPVTTSKPDAQFFFDQGTAQLHTFYFFEAERSFRQAALLDPECAMTYWGLAMANTNNSGRARRFLGKAETLAPKATDRERKHIEALAASLKEGKSDAERRSDYVRGLENVVLAYSDDIEAKAFLAWTIISNGFAGDKLSSHVAVDRLIADVLEKNPTHPGAHHYRIHLWDGHDPIQALASAQAYAKAAPGIAHAWHMPGHIFNGLSRWHEACYQQEGSARVDHAHMLAHAVLPFQIHNYAHNEHYLVANLSHKGGLKDAIAFSRNLVETPRDPGNENAQRLGRFSLMRVLVRYERWDDLLASDPHLEWSEDPVERCWRSYSLGFAGLGKGDLAKAHEEAAKLDALAAETAKRPGRDADLIETARDELDGRLLVAEGSLVEGFDMLSKGARTQVEKFKGDLAGYPRPFHESIGLAHLAVKDWGSAEAHFRDVLADRKGCIVSLAGLVEALHGGGKAKEAAAAYGEFLAAWADADQDLPLKRRIDGARPTVVEADPPAPRAVFASATTVVAADEGLAPLEPLGPKLWSPSPAPDFELVDSTGAKVKLSSFRGKSVVLAFFLGGACPHCVEQLTVLGKEKAAFESLGAVVLAASEDTPEKHRELLAGPKGASIPFPLLSDPDRKVAKSFHAHDTFEDLDLHGIFFLDRAGGIRWARVSADPFTDVGFLKSEIERVNKLTAPAAK